MVAFKRYFSLGYYNDEIIINIKTSFLYGGNAFLNSWFCKIFWKCCNLFCFAHFDNLLKWYVSIIQVKVNFLVLHNLMKCFPGTIVNQKVNKCLNGCLIFAMCYFWLCKKWCQQNLWWCCNKWMMQEMFEKNVLRIMTLLNNLVLICRFWHNLAFCLLYMICEICVFC